MSPNQHAAMVAARKAGNPCIFPRTFKAAEYPKGSEERERLNKNPIHSDKKQDHPYVMLRADAEPEYFGREVLARERLAELLRPHMGGVVPMPFAGTPPIPGDPDEVIKEGEFAGKTLGQAHAEHFDPKVSDEDFLLRRANALGMKTPEHEMQLVNPDLTVQEREQDAHDQLLAEAARRGIHVPKDKIEVINIE